MKIHPAALLLVAALGVSAVQAADPSVIPADRLTRMWRPKTDGTSAKPSSSSTPSAIAPTVRTRMPKMTLTPPTERVRIPSSPSGAPMTTRMRITENGPGSSNKPSGTKVMPMRIPDKNSNVGANDDQDSPPVKKLPDPKPGPTGSKSQQMKIPGSKSKPQPEHDRDSPPVKRVHIPSSGSKTSTSKEMRIDDSDSPPPRGSSSPRIHIERDEEQQDVGSSPPEETGIRVDAGSGAVFQNIQFQLGSTEFTGSSTYAQLLEIAEAMKSVHGERFLIEGHTCDLGSDLENLSLSARRAQAVRNALVGMGVPRSQLQVMGFGEEDPAVPNRDEESRSQNRRVQIFRRL